MYFVSNLESGSKCPQTRCVPVKTGADCLDSVTQQRTDRKRVKKQTMPYKHRESIRFCSEFQISGKKNTDLSLNLCQSKATNEQSGYNMNAQPSLPLVLCYTVVTVMKNVQTIY